MTGDVEQILATATLVTELMSGAGNAMSLYLTVVSGYLLVAYLAGKELTSLQTFIITTLFIFMASSNTLAAIGYFQNAYHFGNTFGAGRVPGWGGPVVGTIQSFGILASVKFMWDVRHPKIE